MAEADFSNKNLGTGGVIIIGAWLTHKDKGALSSANLLRNDIGIDQARALVSILKEHPTLKSLCGNKGGETQLDMSGKMEGAADAIMLAPEIIDNGALSKLTFSGGHWGQYHCWEEGDAATLQSGMIDANFSNKMLGVPGAMIISAWLSSGKDNGTLTKLDISNNNIEQGEALQRIAGLCNTKGVELDNHKSESESDGDY
jgi:hypothetical protein